MLFGSFVIEILSMLLFAQQNALRKKAAPKPSQQFLCRSVLSCPCISVLVTVRSSVDPVAMRVAAASSWVVILAVGLAVLVQVFLLCSLLARLVRVVGRCCPSWRLPCRACCARGGARVFQCCLFNGKWVPGRARRRPLIGCSYYGIQQGGWQLEISIL